MGNVVSQFLGGGGGGGNLGPPPDFSGQYNTAAGRTEDLFSPFVQAGASALPELAAKTGQGFTAADFFADPGYEWQLQQGSRAVQQASGMQGSPFGGNAMAALEQYGQGLAAQTYQNAFNRWQTQVGNLQALAGMGGNAAGAQASNLTNLFGAFTGAEANAYAAQAGVEGSRVARGGSAVGALSNVLGL